MRERERREGRERERKLTRRRQQRGQSQTGILLAAQCCHLLLLDCDIRIQGLASEEVSNGEDFKMLQLRVTAGPHCAQKGVYAISYVYLKQCILMNICMSTTISQRPAVHQHYLESQEK